MQPPTPQLDFKTVYREHASLVRHVLTRHGVRGPDLDDVAQDTFVTVHRQLPTFEGRASLGTWLYAIARRVASDYHQRSRSLSELSGEAPEPAVVTATDVGAADLHALLDHVGPEQRDLLALHYAGGLSIAELSELTGAARATVRRRIGWARATIARRLFAQPARISKETGHAHAVSDWRLPPNPEAEHLCRDACFSILGDLAIAVWRGEPTANALETLGRILIRAADHHPDGILFLSVVESTSTPPSRACRQLTGRLLASVGRSVRAAAWAAETPALFGLMPPVINACVFLGGWQLEVRFFRAVSESVAWLSRRTIAATAEQMNERVAVMRGRLDAAVDPLIRPAADSPAEKQKKMFHVGRGAPLTARGTRR
jgi:RNA polymerase sigma-70 factor, ECF subfamily